MFDQQRRLRYVNPAGEMLLEVSAKRLIGMSLHELFFGANELTKAVESAYMSGQPFTERDLLLTLPNTKTTSVHCSVTPIIEASQQTSVLMELHPMAHNYTVSRKETPAAQTQAIRQLIRGLAHEIKNPLGGLRGAAQLLEKEVASDTLKEYTNIIIGEADRLRNLVNRLLGPNTLPKQTRINIHEITEHVRQIIRAQAHENIRILLDYDPSIPEIFADRDQLIQAFLNIAVNATQAISDESGTITFRTRALRQITINQTLHKLVCSVDVIDNGPGVPEGIIETLFLPMVSTRANGSGLGLAISQSLIQQHNGVIYCESKPGNTKFTILIPIEDKDHVK